LARLIGSKLSEKWGQRWWWTTSQGPAVSSGLTFVAHSAPDGYTVGWINDSHTTTPTLNKLGYDPINSFAPVTEVAYTPFVLVVAPSLPVNSLKELVAFAKSKPGQLNSAVRGSVHRHICRCCCSCNRPESIWFMYLHGRFILGGRDCGRRDSAEVRRSIVHRGSGEGRQNSGHLPSASNVRSPTFPDVPTVAEALDLPHFDGPTVSVWRLLPAGTPQEIVEQLNRDILPRPQIRRISNHSC